MAKSSSSKESDIIPVGGNSGARLKSFVERIVRLEGEKKSLGEDVRDVYTEAKSVGFDTKILRKVVKRSQMDAQKRAEEDELLDMYEHALSQLSDMME